MAGMRNEMAGGPVEFAAGIYDIDGGYNYTENVMNEDIVVCLVFVTGWAVSRLVHATLDRMIADED